MSAPETEDRSALHAMQQQQRLWPDPQPLVERLGRDFFRSLPERPGVYLMRGSGEIVLYVGKAKNLRKRLGSYRVANPDRLSRRHLRLLNSVSHIELHECDSEDSALAKEATLLRNLRPRFNRAGTWPSSPQYLIWRASQHALDLGITLSPIHTPTHTPPPTPLWSSFGPLGSWAIQFRNALLRLLWCALFPGRGLAGMPQGWFHGRCGNIATIPLPPEFLPLL